MLLKRFELTFSLQLTWKSTIPSWVVMGIFIKFLYVQGHSELSQNNSLINETSSLKWNIAKILFTDRTRLAYVSAAVVGAGTAVFFVWWWWTRRQRHRPPSKWRKVGELSDLICFPVKSLGPIRVNSMECTMLGLKSGWMRDRTLMVIDLDGQFITGRQMPRMVQVRWIFFVMLFMHAWLYSEF